MTRHPTDTEHPPIPDYDATHAHQDATRDLPGPNMHLIPPLAAYDIHGRLMDAIREARKDATFLPSSLRGREVGLCMAYRIVFGVDPT